MTASKTVKGIVCACLLLAGCTVAQSTRLDADKGGTNNKKTVAKDASLAHDAILEVMRRSCDWQLANLPKETVVNNQIRKIDDNGWIRAAFFTGVMAIYRTTHDEKYLNAVIEWGDRNGWKTTGRPRHADDFCCGQTYVEAYEIKKDPKMIAPLRAACDAIVADPMRGPVVGWSNNNNWAWCDALYMAPPTYAKLAKATGEQKYLDTMNTMYWDSTEYLYSPQHALFHRDGAYLPTANPLKLEKNGQPIFWSRGDGWVLGGLARVIPVLPANYPDRARYEKLFKDMAAALAKIQREDGTWSSSLLDPASYPEPETSGTAFFCYGIAWGVNNGYLDAETYQPVAEKAWKSLVSNVDAQGKLHWVQLVGKEPGHVKADDTVEYATGALLLAGSEVIKFK